MICPIWTDIWQEGKNVIIDVDVIEKYLEEHPDTVDRVNSVRR